MKPPFFSITVLAVAALFCSVLAVQPLHSAQPNGCIQTPTASCFSSGWPQESSDLQPDPALIFGTLANGLRYVLLPNKEPENRVALYLNIQAGSLHETEEQRGVAHFLEHMLFNGTTHYPPGTLVEYFQSIGMEFGGDINAHTSWSETVYNLLLPSGETTVLAEGFKVLADYARGALLIEQEVERERGIILAEKRTRDSAASRVSKQQMQFAFADTLVARRDPIGVDTVLKSADSHLLRSFYDQWYRPENMIVVVVGAIQIPETINVLTQTFAGLQATGKVGTCPDLGKVREAGIETLVIPEPELGYTGLSLGTVFNHNPGPNTRASALEQVRQYLAMTLLSNRLKHLSQQAGSPLAQPQAQSGLLLHRYGYAGLTARAEKGQWQAVLGLLQTLLSQALQDGFTETELERGKRELVALLQKAVQTAPSRDSRQVAEEIIRKLNANEVVLNPAQEMALYWPAVQAMTIDDVNAALRQLFQHPRRLVELVGVIEAGLSAEQARQQLQALYQANAAKAVTPWVATQRPPFPYLEMPTVPAEIISRDTYAAIGVERIRFAGGVTLNIKPTDFQANQVLLSAHLGQGRQGEPKDGLASSAESLLRESGIGKLSKEQLAEALAGTNIALDFRVGTESFSFNGSSLRGEFITLLQLLRHRLQDPVFQAEPFRRSRESLRRRYDQLNGTVEGVFQVAGERFLAGSSKEYGLPTWEQVSSITLEQIEQWLAPAFQQAPLEINIVGDIDPQEVVRQVALAFGGGQRQDLEIVPTPEAVFPAGQQQILSVHSASDKAILVVAWKTNDFWEIGRTRRLNLLAAVLGDRLRVQIREELGAIYTSRVVNQPSRIHNGFGLMQGSLIAAPQQAEALAKIIKETAENLGSQGVSKDELRRALEPTLTSIKDLKRNNRYWLESVLNLSGRHPQQLQWPLSILDDFSAITAEELNELARQYLAPDQSATVIVRPLHP